MAFKHMAKHSGENVAKRVSQGRVILSLGDWRLLAADGSSNLAGRTHIRLQSQGKPGNAVAIAYAVGTTTDGYTYSFTAPTSTTLIKNCTVFRGTATWVEPLGEAVQIYGRLNAKAGATENSVAVIVTEYA